VIIGGKDVMAIYIPIRKVREDAESVEYRFGDYGQDRWGVLRLDKRSGEVVIVEPAPGDEKGFLAGPVPP
jgi:hypothetical protein